MRLNAWICKKFNILPSNPDFQNLTDEQKEWLWEDYLIDNPEIRRRIELANDEEFIDAWDNLDDAEDTSDLDKYSDIEESSKEFFDDVERSEEAQSILKQIRESESKVEFENDILDEDDAEFSDLSEVEFSDDDLSDEWEEVDD